MKEIKPRSSIKKQPLTTPPFIADNTLVDDPVALVDDPTALVGGPTTIIDSIRTQVKVTRPHPSIKKFR